jgi:anaerobic magnesium-protoporphyrin IX monomethyl ester cyclase
MKIVLIRLNSAADEVIPPLSLGFLAKALRKRHQVVVIDCLLGKLGPADMQSLGMEFDIAGITLFSKDLALCRKYLMSLKRSKPSLVTVLGGPHPSAMPVETLTFFGDLCDFVMAGEAETGFAKLADELSLHRPDFTGVEGLCYRDGNDVILNKAVYPEPLDDHTVAWDLMPPSSYPPAPHGAFFKQYPVAPIITSRGCPYGCLFCAGHTVTGKRIRRRSLGHVLEEIEHLWRGYGVREIHIEDDNFTADKGYVLEFCRAVRSRFPGLSWACPNGVRIDTLDEEMVAAMKKAGCYALSFGLESGNDDTLSAMGKRLTVSDLRRRIAMVHHAEIETIGFFVLGFPGETRRHIDTTIEFALSLPLIRASFATFQPFPGTPIFSELVRSGAIELKDWNSFAPNLQTTVWSPQGISVRELAGLRKKALLRFYLRYPIMKSMVLNIKGRDHVLYILKRVFRWLFPKNRLTSS